MKILKKVMLFLLNYLPLQIWTLKICTHDISKTITARSFNLGLLIEDDELINWLKLKKKVILFFRIISLCRFGL